MPTLDNPQHEIFAQQIFQGVSQRDAYKAAGYVTKSVAAADASASRLLSHVKVAARIQELQTAASARAVEKSAVSKAWVIAKLVENVERAMTAEPVRDAQGNPTGEFKYNGNVANRALELIGKEQGMFVDRKEIGDPGDFARLSDDELNAELMATAQELGMRPDKRATKH
jgi:phage terminase small subunit